MMTDKINPAGRGADPMNIPDHYFYVYDAYRHGPVVLDNLVDRINTCRLSRQVLVWRRGLADWAPAESLPEIATRLPPPIPKSPRPPLSPSAPSSVTQRGPSRTDPRGFGATVFVVEALEEDGETTSHASGVLVGPQEVVTNSRVVKNAVSLRVKRADRRWAATVAAVDEDRDLARLLARGIDGTAATMRLSQTLKRGERVYTVAALQSVDLENSLAEVLISELRPYGDAQLIQTRPPISSESIGAGVFDDQGRLVGITTPDPRHGQDLFRVIPSEWIGEIASHRPLSLGTRIHNDPRFWLALGQQQVEGRQLTEAARSYRKAVWIAPGDPEGWKHLGCALYGVGKIAEAVGCFREAVCLEPDEPWNHYALGKGLSDTARYAEASRELREAVRLDPSDRHSWFELGRVCERTETKLVSPSARGSSHDDRRLRGEESVIPRSTSRE